MAIEINISHASDPFGFLYSESLGGVPTSTYLSSTLKITARSSSIPADWPVPFDASGLIVPRKDIYLNSNAHEGYIVVKKIGTKWYLKHDWGSTESSHVIASHDVTVAGVYHFIHEHEAVYHGKTIKGAYLNITTAAMALANDWWSFYVSINSSVQTLFNNVSALEFASGSTHYRCIYYVNNGTLAKTINLEIEDDGCLCGYYIGADPVGVAPKATATVQTIVDETTAPTGVTFSKKVTAKLGVDECIAIWVRRSLYPETFPPTSLNILCRAI